MLECSGIFVVIYSHPKGDALKLYQLGDFSFYKRLIELRASPIAVSPSASRFESLTDRLADLLKMASRESAKKLASPRRFEGAGRHCGVPIGQRPFFVLF